MQPRSEQVRHSGSQAVKLGSRCHIGSGIEGSGHGRRRVRRHLAVGAYLRNRRGIRRICRRSLVADLLPGIAGVRHPTGAVQHHEHRGRVRHRHRWTALRQKGTCRPAQARDHLRLHRPGRWHHRRAAALGAAGKSVRMRSPAAHPVQRVAYCAQPAQESRRT